MAKQYGLQPRMSLAPVIAAGGGSPAEGGVPGMDPAAIKRAFLRTIAKGEAPIGAYDYMLGGGRFKDFSKHPGVLNSSPYGSSTAAGQYQFLKSTWDEEAAKYGYKDFKPETQDTAAWNYARDIYKQKTGQNLEEVLASGDPDAINNISKVLGPTWTSLPGGPQPNSNWKGANFADVYNQNLGAGDAGGGEVAEGSTQTDTTTAGTDTSGTGSDSKDEKKTKKKADYRDALGEGLEKIGAGYANSQDKTTAARAASSTTVPAAALPAPPAPMSMVDPRMIEMQRQQLAQAMQRLNSGKLV